MAIRGGDIINQMKTNLKPILPEQEDKPLHHKKMHEIVGRKFKKQKLTPPYFPVELTPPTEEKGLRYWLNRLKK
jgi:hypothetical protein